MANKVSPFARREFIVIAALIVCGHVLDLISTYTANPDLSREVGPLYLKLASLGKGTWGLLITFKLLFATVSVLAYQLIMRARRSFYPQQPLGSVRDFLHAVHSRRALRSADGRWIMPSPRLLLLWVVNIITVGAGIYALALAIHNFCGSPPWMEQLGRLVAGLVGVFSFWVCAWYDYRHLPVDDSAVAAPTFRD